jgi:hypothetical protein
VRSLLIGALVLGGLLAGIGLRRAVWDATEATRKSEDIENGYQWGQRALAHRFFGLYDHVVASRADGDYVLDYLPLRLLVMAAWARWTNGAFPGPPGWRPHYAFNAPLLHLNTLAALAAAVGAFFLVRLWAVRAAAPGSPAVPFHGWGRGLAAAMLFWLNPALLIDAHAWPQWDVWPMPFVVFALLAASCDRWFVAGMLTGLGAMLKGQVLLVAPVLVFWPLFMKAPKSAARAALGMVLAILLVGSPWLIRGSLSWLKVGVFYGESKFQDMTVGAANLPALLEKFLGVQARSPVWTIDLPALSIRATVTAKHVLAGGYAVALLVSAACAAVFAKRRDPRVLIALTLPWVVLFALLTQMHDRYLVWGACLGTVWVAAGWRATATNLLVSALTFLNIASVMNDAAPGSLPAPLLKAVAPWLAWLVLAATGLGVWQMVAPAVRGGRNRRPLGEDASATETTSSAPQLVG